MFHKFITFFIITDGVSKRNTAETAMLIHRPTAALRSVTNAPTTIHMNNARPKSAKHKLFIKTNKVSLRIIQLSLLYVCFL